ncbi:MAG: hypothetical protein ABI193_21575 [Minicystis sp.]
MAKASAAKKKSPARASSPLTELGLGAAWLIGLSALLLIVEAAVGKSMVGVAVAGAVIVELSAGWAGVRWDLGPPRPFEAILRRLGAGLGLATALVVVAVLVSLAAGWAHAGLGHPSLSLALAVVRAGSLGVRDELLLCGIPLAACARAGVRPLHARGFAALASAAPLVLVPEASIAAIVLAAALGWLFASLWQHERSGYAAAAAHAGYLLVVRALLQGELFDLSFPRGALSIGARAAGAPAFLMALLAIVAAFLLPRLPGFRASFPEQAPPVDERP